MRSLSSIKKEEIRDLLGKGWLTHDAMWFFHIAQEFGIERANTLNKAAIKSMSVIEAQRLAEILGMGKKRIEHFEEIKGFLLEGMKLTLPCSVFSKFRMAACSNNVLHWEWVDGECFAYKGMKRMGLLDGYQCGVVYRIECWFRTLGIKFNSTPRIGKCLMHETGRCAGDFEFFFDD